jgi:hypothetical protein
MLSRWVCAGLRGRTWRFRSVGLQALLSHGQAELAEDVGEAAYSHQLRSFSLRVCGTERRQRRAMREQSGLPSIHEPGTRARRAPDR